jgi:hypothetical protein
LDFDEGAAAERYFSRGLTRTDADL